MKTTIGVQSDTYNLAVEVRGVELMVLFEPKTAGHLAGLPPAGLKLSIAQAKGTVDALRAAIADASRRKYGK